MAVRENSSPSCLYDAVVVGAGIQGSFTAYHLAKRGQKTLLLEQFPLPHTRGSSHGQSRIIRSAYPQDYYVAMMKRAYQLWAELEAEAGTPLQRPTPMLVLGRQQNPEFQSYWQTMQRLDIPHETFTPQALAQKYPEIRPHGGEMAVADLTAGVLYPDKALKAVQPLRIHVYYWRAKDSGTRSHVEHLPCFLGINLNQDAHHIYGLPTDEYPGLVKICYHHGSPVEPDRPDQLDRASTVPDLQILQGFVRNYLPGLDPEPAVQEHCLYTNTPDEDFILDRHPRFNNIVIGAGFSGHGFKFAPVVGEILCQLSLGEEPPYNLAHFRISRFPASPKAAL
ncbi:PREDICTED: peroxisomal sarcosine oxidase isoform X2 [Gekko japonicus]|uniref:L-amino-acid oxidase n=1 Tax=Gekko japonicus TaxID=146911 RepID=A0ABM1KUI8_GEKJA|nr:PREDICTED: peroxisomal sarcosine oxidase isoform X2 [Gekko japonicus]